MDAFPPGWETRLAPFPHARSAPPHDDALDEAGIRLRSARFRDLPALARIHAAGRQQELLLAPWSTEAKLTFLNDQFRLQHTHYVRHFSKADFWVAIDAAEIVIGKLYIDRSTPEWRIIDILLAPDHQGKGMGSALLDWIQRAAAAAGASSVALTVAAGARAQALYRRFGFEEMPGGDTLTLPMRWTPGTA